MGCYGERYGLLMTELVLRLGVKFRFGLLGFSIRL